MEDFLSFFLVIQWQVYVTVNLAVFNLETLKVYVFIFWILFNSIKTIFNILKYVYF